MMNDREKQFVWRHYKPASLDADKALRRFKVATGYAAKRPMWQWAGIAATLLVLVGVTLTMLYQQRETVFLADARQKIVTLDDGTRITLAPHSSISYHGNDCRTVEIEGRAYLEIKHDEHRPFQVRDAHYIINDIGTKFTVEEKDGTTTVYVTEGSVYFGTAKSGSQGVTLTEGMGAALADGSDKPRVIARRANPQVWATGTFHFDDTPLEEVLDELSGYYHVKLTCSDCNKRLTGDFDASDIHEVIGIIEHTLNVRITMP